MKRKMYLFFAAVMILSAMTIGLFAITSNAATCNFSSSVTPLCATSQSNQRDIADAQTVKFVNFRDVSGNKNLHAINVLAGIGILGGYPDGTFQPDEIVERDVMAKLLFVTATASDNADVPDEDVYADIPKTYWASGYINWCKQMNIMGGYGDGTFRPDSPVTYDVALKLVCLILGYTDFDSALWPTDVRMLALKILKLGEGLEDVKGADKLTRGQVAQLLYNALTTDMNETKQTLADDVWKISEHTYTVIATENCGIGTEKTGVSDMIGVTPAINDKTVLKLEDISIQKYVNNTDRLIGLNIHAVHSLANNELVSVYIEFKNIVGGCDGDQEVTIDDAIHLAFYTFYPDRYPIPNGMDVDFNNDGEVTIDDAIYLAFYTFYPDRYPLN